ncbi:hypothetical protein [Maricaulis sp.]|uniref:hypothetical protein n=1 Tax=Maricaulis sp. TaxID=1486257 RepID=UPI003A92F949
MNAPHKRTTSPGHAVLWGLLSINGPVLVLLISAFTLPLLVGGILGSFATTPFGIALLVLVAVGTWCLAWLWWSVNVPRWRLWAYTRVEDLDALHQAAVALGVLWPDGHFFERTEIYPRGLREKVELARRR